MKAAWYLVLVCCSSTALAQSSSAENAEAHWSMGGGLALFDSSAPIILVVTTGSSGPTGVGTSLLTATSAPRLNASVERRITERNWLVTGISASYATTDKPPVTVGTGGSSTVRGESTSVHGLASVGVRRAVILREGMPVVGSVQAGLYGGYVSNRSSSAMSPVGSSSSVTFGDSYDGWVVGGTAALVVDGHLNDYVSLRVSTNVARVSRTSAEISTTAPDPFGNSTSRKESSTSVQASATFEPTLELRIFF